MERNSPYKNLSRRQEKNLLKVAEAALRSEFQIPERTGCPTILTDGVRRPRRSHWNLLAVLC
jgi:hypothetical protein